MTRLHLLKSITGSKGFVILSGVSGTGKSKLPQQFAEVMPQPVTYPVADGRAVTTLTVRPYMLKYNQLTIPKRVTLLFDPPAPGESRPVEVTWRDLTETCRLTHLSYQSTRYVSIRLKGAVRAAFVNELQDGDQFTLEPLLDEDQNLIGFRLDTSLSPPVLTPATAMGTPLLFTSVRPEWRDSQSLLGYYNPLTGDYEWTPFLRFLLRAKRSFETQDGLAWFVILDEMNLARVEYNFADLLSVLESGRDAEGWTREPLRLGYPEEAEGDLPPRELRLPPNLYLIGTVNMDETTPAFSPKVLDRAFTLELSEVDFTDYPVAPSAGDNRVLNDKDRHQLLADFSGGGRFARIDKAVISHYAAVHPEIGKRLQTLNSLLRPFNLHFGYWSDPLRANQRQSQLRCLAVWSASNSIGGR